MKLVIGNKNYSSWSLRPWLALKQAGIAFEEVRLSFNAPDFKQQALRYSPTARVPVLLDGPIAVWDSLAIVEYLAEKFPDRQVWPAAVAARAEARAVSAEMHASFQALRNAMSMNISAPLAGLGWNVEVQKDIDRVAQILAGRTRFAAEGPFLFGRFSAADAFFAPVVWRFNTYQPKLPAQAVDYVKAMLALPAMQSWAADAQRENEFVEHDEPYRTAPQAAR